MAEPPIGDPLPDTLLRRCSYDRTLNGSEVCGRRAVSHADWNTTLPFDDPNSASGFSCLKHHAEAEVKGWLSPPAAWHLVGADCGMPGAMWFTNPDGSSFCRVPDDLATFSRERAIAEPTMAGAV